MPVAQPLSGKHFKPMESREEASMDYNQEVEPLPLFFPFETQEAWAHALRLEALRASMEPGNDLPPEPSESELKHQLLDAYRALISLSTVEGSPKGRHEQRAIAKRAMRLEAMIRDERVRRRAEGPRRTEAGNYGG